MKITVITLLNCSQALIEFAATKGLPPKISFRIATKVLRKAENYINEFQTARGALFKRLGTQIEDGPNKGGWEVKDTSPNKAEFDKERKALEEEQVDFPIDPIKLEELGEKVDISPALFCALDWLIIE